VPRQELTCTNHGDMVTAPKHPIVFNQLLTDIIFIALIKWRLNCTERISFFKVEHFKSFLWIGSDGSINTQAGDSVLSISEVF
jgi:hypothetical protein